MMAREITSFVYVTFIAAAPEAVFDAIVNPEIARRYWAHENVSDWTPGSRWEHVRADESRGVALAGEVIECSPPSRLVISWANASEFDDKAKHSRVTFDVVPYEGMTKLIVAHDELEVGSRMLEGISKGWPIVLSSLKSYLETGKPLDVFAKAKAASAPSDAAA
jgi:uncharacterized protein YndB with AHSA1/START domain